MLELVLYLPVMLFVMALMINFGNMAAWKIRAQTNTRYAAWRTLDDRNGQYDPNPPNWPRDATLSTSGGNAMDDANAVWNQNPNLVTPVVRGPVISARNQEGGRIVVPGRFHMDVGVHAGDGRVRRHLPLLRGIFPDNGRYGYTLHQELLDNRWEYRHLNWPRNPYDRGDVPGDSGNARRRAKHWYRIDPQFFPEIQGEFQRFSQADIRLKSNPTRYDLDPLDRDNEFYWFRKRASLGIGIMGPPPPVIPEEYRIRAPDFHPAYDPRPIPKRRNNCSTDKQRVESDVRRVVNRIQHLPGHMGREFSNLYRREIDRLEATKESLEMRIPPPIELIVKYEVEIARLKPLLEQVNRFLSSLPRRNR